ncbi:hypothetical protein [Candidatus Nitrospira salsa]
MKLTLSVRDLKQAAFLKALRLYCGQCGNRELEEVFELPANKKR